MGICCSINRLYSIPELLHAIHHMLHSRHDSFLMDTRPQLSQHTSQRKKPPNRYVAGVGGFDEKRSLCMARSRTVTHSRKDETFVTLRVPAVKGNMAEKGKGRLTAALNKKSLRRAGHRELFVFSR